MKLCERQTRWVNVVNSDTIIVENCNRTFIALFSRNCCVTLIYMCVQEGAKNTSSSFRKMITVMFHVNFPPKKFRTVRTVEIVCSWPFHLSFRKKYFSFTVSLEFLLPTKQLIVNYFHFRLYSRSILFQWYGPNGPSNVEPSLHKRAMWLLTRKQCSQ